jgi:hypothetical protein
MFISLKANECTHFLYFALMKWPLLPTLLILASSVNAQKLISYYDFNWKKTDVAHARFVSSLEHTDSGWRRQDYFVQGPTLQEDGLYEDSACTIRNGEFIYGYPDGKAEAIGRYVHNKRQGLCVSYHPNGMLRDSAVYEAGLPRGTSKSWYSDGTLMDSSVYQADGTIVDVSWFNNGNPSDAGRWTADHKRHGIWTFFHSTGKLSAKELYDHGRLLEKQYYQEDGQPQMDTLLNKDHAPTFGKDSKSWLKYLGDNLQFPPGYKITNSDLAAVVVTFTVDFDGTVKDAYISVPFYEPFNKEAIRIVTRCPKWKPAIDHNRRVSATMRQPVVFSQPAED